jgi:hypothetical protein
MSSPACTLPKALFHLLQEGTHTDAIEWINHGRSFWVKDKDLLTDILAEFNREARQFDSTRRLLCFLGFVRSRYPGE